eukprot:TRINITY_DN7891_c0_g1_i5.p1 TRINITY_DN7891_c0_g1~~TRINITY_DN7891_c0_g1_i5.p1  ORF type:complete len:465 (+),score=91.70 TRINITY_DN7891_c0_g1_i5:238-1632(+)
MSSLIALGAIVAAAVVGAPAVVADKLSAVSFAPPFEQHDSTGARIIAPGWVTDGVTKVAKNFVRLTPDRASKKGSAWSKSPIGKTEATVIVEFRISGKGRRLFGDGLAVWLAQPYRTHDAAWDDDFYFGDQAYGDQAAGNNVYHAWNEWPLGDFHAFEPDFKGIGVIFDTYVNADLPNHKDVTVVINDRNTNDTHVLLENSHGCMSLVRWFEGRDDFHAGKVSSKAKITVANNELTVLVDPKNTGAWQECTKVTLPTDKLEAGWLSSAHIGVTASTGQLADNHDLLRVDVYSDEASADTGEQIRAKRGHEMADSMLAKGAQESGQLGGMKGGVDADGKPLPVEQMTSEERLTRLETYLNVLLVKLELVEHHLEHEMIDLAQTTMESSVALKSQEDRLELQVNHLDIKMSAAEARLQELVEQGMVAAAQRARGWRVPVLLLALFLVGCAVAAALGWRRLRKTHLL